MARIKGSSGNDNLVGTQTNDTMIGGVGNDTLNGREGVDAAQYISNIADYRFSNVNGKLAVVSSAEGKDSLVAIEVLQFGNGQLSVTGGEFQVNSFTAGVQTSPYITALADGGFLVAWESAGQDGDGLGIYAQRYDINGSAQGSDFRVNTYTTNNQNAPSIAGLADGGFVVSWKSDEQDGAGGGIYAQRYNAAGLAEGGEFRVNTYTADSQTNVNITALVNGDFVVTWDSLGQDGDGSGIYAQRYNASGIAQGSEFKVNTHTYNLQENASITALAEGGFVVTWQSFGQDGSSYGVYAQRYDENGTAQGGEFRVNTYTANQQHQPNVTALSDGGFVISWSSLGPDGDSLGVFAQRYNVSGVAQGSEFQVNTNVTNVQSFPITTALTSGGFVVTWQSFGQDGSSYGIYAQRYDENGTAQGDEFRVNTYTTNNQYDNNITALADGGFVVTWSSVGQDGDDKGIYAQRYDANGNAVGTKLTGTANADVINLDVGNAGLVVDGGAGNDIITSASANDTLLGGIGKDILKGNAGDDYLDGGADADKMLGGTGNDTYIINHIKDTVIELANAGVDKVQSSITYTLSKNVENLSLTGSANINGIGNAQGNAIVGNAGNNRLDGKAGHDVLDGSAGNDTLIGGLGNDLLEGGAGNDVFRFNTALSAVNNVDEILDFNVADDTIQLSKTIFTTLSASSAAGTTLIEAAFNAGNFSTAQDASDRIIYNSTTGDLYYDKDGTGAAAAIKFAHLDAGLSLTHADFSVIL